MNGLNQFLEQFPRFTLLAGIGLAIGLIIPTAYECLDEQTLGSHYPKSEFVATIAFLFSTTLSLGIGLYRVKHHQREQNLDRGNPKSLQFGIGHLLVSTTIVAAGAAASQFLELEDIVTAWVVLAVLIGILVWLSFQTWSIRSRVAAILACLFLPFAWIVPVSQPFGHTSGMLPGLLFGPGLLVAVFSRQHIDDSIWIAVMFVLLELGLGIWLSLSGSKRSLAFAVGVLAFSTLTSLAFHALYRV